MLAEALAFAVGERKDLNLDGTNPKPLGPTPGKDVLWGEQMCQIDEARTPEQILRSYVGEDK